MCTNFLRQAMLRLAMVVTLVKSDFFGYFFAEKTYQNKFENKQRSLKNEDFWIK